MNEGFSLLGYRHIDLSINEFLIVHCHFFLYSLFEHHKIVKECALNRLIKIS